MKKKLWPSFSRIIEYDEPQDSVYKGVEIALTRIVRGEMKVQKVFLKILSRIL